jgi:hypothetical protein
VSTKRDHLPHCANKRGISAILFRRPVDFAGALGRKIPERLSPDLFLWGLLKGHLYDNSPHSIEEFKSNISDTGSIIDHERAAVAQSV